MTDKPEALRLADALMEPVVLDKHAMQAAAELRRLHQHELASEMWHTKTEWVQKTSQPGELGMHRADVLRQRIEKLQELNSELLEALQDMLDNRGDYTATRDKARAAIAKAEGKEPCLKDK